MIWDKGLFAMGRGWYHWAHEPCWVVRKPGIRSLPRQPRPGHGLARTEPQDDHGRLRRGEAGPPGAEAGLLFETPIGNHLTAGEAVYDPFLGSGTTVIAAERLGRRCYGIEIEPRYVQVTIERWQAFTGKPRSGSMLEHRSGMPAGAGHDPNHDAHGEGEDAWRQPDHGRIRHDAGRIVGAPHVA